MYVYCILYSKHNYIISEKNNITPEVIQKLKPISPIHMQAINPLVHVLKRKMSPLIFHNCPVGNQHQTRIRSGN